MCLDASRNRKKLEPIGTRNHTLTNPIRRKMQLQNTTLDDVAALIGFSATLQLAAWYGGRTQNLYVPQEVVEGHTLAVLLGLANAQRLSREWGGQLLAIPGIEAYEDLVRKRHVGRMFEKGFGTREIASQMRVSERRVQQICRELEVAGLIPVQGPRRPKIEPPSVLPERRRG